MFALFKLACKLLLSWKYTQRRVVAITEHTDTIDTCPSSVAQVNKEHVYLLYKPSLKAAIATAIAAGFLGFLQWGHIPSFIIVAWLSAMTVVLGCRVYFYFTFLKTQPETEEIKYWQQAYIWLTIVAGAVWGSAGVFLFPEGEFQYQAVTVIILAAMAAGAITTLSALKETALPFLFLIMTPITIHLALGTSELSISFAILCLVYTLFLASASINVYKAFHESICFRLESKTRETTLRKTADILEMIAKGEPVPNIYDAIILLYESRHSGLRCSMLELHGNKLIHGSAPSLPKAYCDAVNGLENGPDIGSCGTSTFTGKRVLVEDIASDPKWAKLKDIALAHDLRCCWSEPIKDKNGKVLGAFGMYYPHAAMPTPDELHDLESAARLAGIVMERQQREVLLEKLHSAFEHAQDAIMITDFEARIEYINPAFEKFTGYSEKDVIGEFTTILRSTQHSEAFYLNFYNHCVQGKPWHGEISIQRKDGSLLDTERNVSPIFSNSGKIMFFVAIMRDLTEKKALEAQFQQAQKMEAIGTLVGGIAHDFNNILAGITGNLYLAKSKATDTEVQQKLQRIEQLSGRATGLIKQLLTFSRKDSVDMKPMLLKPLVQEVFALLRTSTPENIAMQCDIESPELKIFGDATQIHQILLNLANNARDALEGCANPKVTLSTHLFDASKHITTNHTYFKPQKYAQLTVSDNGIGIAEDELEHLFEPFFTTKEIGKGTGLGLAMVFGAVKRHKGYIEVSSQQGKGSTFNVYIPLLESNQSGIAIAQQQGLMTGNQETILLIDDDADLLTIGTELLESLGYQVLQARDGAEALSLFQHHSNDIALVITDVVMPVMGGVEAVAAMRNIQPKLKAIYTTGYDKNIATNKADVAADDILSKPYNIEILSQRIQLKLNHT